MRKYIVVHGIKIAKDFVPETFGRLTTIGPSFRTGRHTRQVFACACGNILCTRTSSVREGSSTSCGCRRSEEVRTRRTYHGYATEKPAEYRTWKGMRQRCNNPKDKNYTDYGGRGITVCLRWQEPKGEGFINFLEDMGIRPSIEGKRISVNRKDNNGPYSPDNCEWADEDTQANNKRTSVLVEYEGTTMTVGQWEKHLGFPRCRLAKRIRSGWTIEKAMTTPTKHQKTTKIPEPT